MPPINTGTLQGDETNELNALINDRRDIEFGDAILSLEPNAAPLTVILGRIAKKPVQEVEFRWFEENPLARFQRVENGFDNLATTITLPDASGFYVDDVIKATMLDSANGSLVEEMMLVTAVDYSTNTITVVRGYGESDVRDFSAASSTNPIEIVTMGNLSAEGSGAPTDRANQPVVLYNICGITKTPFSVTGTVDRSRQRANPQERARLQRYWGVEHRKSVEAKLIWGKRAEEIDAQGRVRRVNEGIVSFIRSNKFDLGGSLTYDKLVEYAEQIFLYGSQEKWCFAGPAFLTAIAKIGLDKLMVSQGEEQFGVKYNRIVTQHGDLLLVRHPMMVGPVWSRAAIILDLGSANGVPRVQYRPLQNGGDTRLQLNIQNNDEDIVRDQYFTEASVAVRQEQTHAILFNAG